MQLNVDGVHAFRANQQRKANFDYLVRLNLSLKTFSKANLIINWAHLRTQNEKRLAYL